MLGAAESNPTSCDCIHPICNPFMLSCLDFPVILISPPSLGVYYCQQLTLSVLMSGGLSVCHKLQNTSYLFLDGIEPFLAISSRWPPLQNCFSLIFDLGPLTTKMYSPKFAKKCLYVKSACMADRLEMFRHTRGFTGMADSMGPCKILWGRPLLPWQRNLG